MFQSFEWMLRMYVWLYASYWQQYYILMLVITVCNDQNMWHQMRFSTWDRLHAGNRNRQPKKVQKNLETKKEENWRCQQLFIFFQHPWCGLLTSGIQLWVKKKTHISASLFLSSYFIHQQHPCTFISENCSLSFCCKESVLVTLFKLV